MSVTKQPAAYLLLEDGTFFKGKSIGAIGTSSGELCFNTGMTGYQEIFSDLSYTGQLMTMANVHIGNYGTVDNESESANATIAGLICKSFSTNYSRPLSNKSLQNYLVENAVVGIEGIDTRFLVSHIRKNGSMNAVISSEISSLDELKKILANTASMEGLELASKVTSKHFVDYAVQNPTGKVALIDFGTKQNIVRCLTERGANVRVFPANTSINQLKEYNANGFLISNGPGDPAAMSNAIALIKEIIELNKPVFGICLGHQLIALALGLQTFKMKNGHRGINHPVKNLLTGKSEITSQNHGFAVAANDLANFPHIQITHQNLNDNSIEGLRVKEKNIFCVQHHPEAAPGPNDSKYLFDEFLAMI
jgi:carbamoyl-phosphate synthase small subunit